MSVLRLKNGFGFECDAIGCGEQWLPPHLGLGSEMPEFTDNWLSAKAEGWRTRPIGGYKQLRGGETSKDWEHRCPKCSF